MTDRWQQVDGDRHAGRNPERQRGMLTVGILLVLLGLAFLAGEALNLDYNRVGWPIWVIAPGVFLLLLGLAIPYEGGLGAAIPGGLLTSVGLLLAFQDATGTYASWSYTWALVAPGSVGVTLALFGLLHRRWDLLDSGLRTAAVGLGLFIGFGLFFENILGIDEGQPDTIFRVALPFMAVGLGVVIVIFNLIPNRFRSRVGPDAWTPVDPTTPPTPPTPPAI
jgi:hypothetical protein